MISDRLALPFNACGGRKESLYAQDTLLGFIKCDMEAPRWLPMKPPKGMTRPAQGMKPVLRLLKLAKAPAMLGMIVSMMFIQMPDGTFTQPRFYMSEGYAGAAAVTKAFRADGKPSMAMDKKYGDEFDVLTNVGFLTHVKVFLQTEVACVLAPVCSSFTLVNAGTAARSICRPLGNNQYDSVRTANMMVIKIVGTSMWMLEVNLEI